MPEAAALNGKVGLLFISRVRRGVLNVFRVPRPLGTRRHTFGGDTRPRTGQEALGLARRTSQGCVM